MLPLFSFYFITPFKDLINCYVNGSIIKRARNQRLIKIRYINPRRFSVDKHKTIDDKPFGGGSGMVYMLDPFLKAIEYVKKVGLSHNLGDILSYTILFSPEGKLLNNQFAFDFISFFIKYKKGRFEVNKKCQHIKEIRFILLMPRYEGIDARIYNFVDIIISIGPFILTGAELPALIFLDSFVRFIPGVLGDYNSALYDSFFELKSKLNIVVNKKAPIYTRPYIYNFNNRMYKVPDVLRTGDHNKINIWKKQHSKKMKLSVLKATDFKVPCLKKM